MPHTLTPEEHGAVLDAIVDFDRFILNVRADLTVAQWHMFMHNIEDGPRKYNCDNPTQLPAPNTTCLRCHCDISLELPSRHSPSVYYCKECFEAAITPPPINGATP